MKRKLGAGAIAVLIVTAVTAACGTLAALEHNDDQLALLLLLVFVGACLYIAVHIPY